MRLLAFVFALVSFASFTFAQKPDVEVYEKKDGDKVVVIARNTGQSDYNVKVTITSEGMDVSPSSVVEAKIPAGYMKEMATITPRPGATWSYGYDVAITQTVAKTTAILATPVAPTGQKPAAAGTTTTSKPAAPDPSLSTAKIILYAKPGCGRCTIVRNQMNELGIEYFEVNTQSTSPEVGNMWSQMRSQGFPGGSVTMPVVRVNGKYHYDIKNLQEFVNNLKS